MCSGSRSSAPDDMRASIGTGSCRVRKIPLRVAGLPGSHIHARVLAEDMPSTRQCRRRPVSTRKVLRRGTYSYARAGICAPPLKRRLSRLK